MPATTSRSYRYRLTLRLPGEFTLDTVEEIHEFLRTIGAPDRQDDRTLICELTVDRFANDFEAGVRFAEMIEEVRAELACRGLPGFDEHADDDDWKIEPVADAPRPWGGT